MSKKKKNNRQAEKRRAKKALRQKAKRPARMERRTAQRKVQEILRAIRRSKTLQAASLLQDGVKVPDITDDEHIFWLCHGANFIASDEENGVWDPIFENIYGPEAMLPAAENVAQRVLSKYVTEIEAEEDLSGVPRSVLAWTVTEKSTVRIYKYECEKRLHDKDPECDAHALAREPYNTTVWAVMAMVKARTMAA